MDDPKGPKDNEDNEVLVDIELEKVCPICLEGKELLKLSCSHYIHLECAKNMTDSLCPLCRKSLKEELPSDILESIEDRGQEYQANLVAEDIERLNINSFDPARAITLFVRPRPHIEVLAAINHLRNEKIPLQYLPKRIHIKIPRGHPKPPIGTIFNTLVGHAISRMKSVVGTISESESDGSESESDSSDSEETTFRRDDIEVSDVDPDTL